MTSKERRIAEALGILKVLGMPDEQLNDRTAICLLALLDLPPNRSWSEARNPMLGIRAILDFAREKLGRNYAENTRESIRKYSVKQLVSAGVLLHNPDKPDRAVNSSDNCYQVEEHALPLLKQFRSATWRASLETYLAARQTLAAQYACARDLHRIPVKVKGPEAPCRCESARWASLFDDGARFRTADRRCPVFDADAEPRGCGRRFRLHGR